MKYDTAEMNSEVHTNGAKLYRRLWKAEPVYTGEKLREIRKKQTKEALKENGITSTNVYEW